MIETDDVQSMSCHVVYLPDTKNARARRSSTCGSALKRKDGIAGSGEQQQSLETLGTAVQEMQRSVD